MPATDAPFCASQPLTPHAATARAHVTQAELYRRELEHIKAGLYRAPYDMDARHRQFSPAYIADKASRLLRASAETVARRGRPDGGRDVLATATDAAVTLDAAAEAAGFVYPEYYLQNFHFQTDGWMSVRSSRSCACARSAQRSASAAHSHRTRNASQAHSR